mmetsp:Transcript_94572/g.300127  ORF Transcript_94572/g.300127 Transcript_94572/m.300127 type:complete len:307 (+) Transcript_94572:89-1009(+)
MAAVGAPAADEEGPAATRRAARKRGSEGDASATEHAISALVGYTMGAVVVLPFDRLKTLMQVAAQEGRHVTALRLTRSVVAEQGLRGLYQGTGPHMLIAPYTMFYYSVYSQALAWGQGHPLAPLGAAMFARGIETTLRMPLELIRTQMQAAEGSATLASCVRAQWRQPLSAWFRGWVPTLLRDVPFSGIYWFSYEHFMLRVSVPEEWVPVPGLRKFVQAYCSGAAAGMVAALATTPTDVIKTVRQQHVELGRSPGYSIILQLLRTDPRRAFAGVGPRLVRIPLGLSTMMSGLEVTKWAFERQRLSC